MTIPSGEAVSGEELMVGVADPPCIWIGELKLGPGSAGAGMKGSKSLMGLCGLCYGEGSLERQRGHKECRWAEQVVRAQG